MEKVTKIDLQRAFKELDALEYPKAVLMESVRKLPTASALTEEFYDIDSPEDVKAATAERENEIAKTKLAKIEKIVDLDAKTPEDLEKSYSGKTIIQCPQCMTMFYKDPDELIVSEDDPSVCNVDEKCQHCGNETGYTLVGKVAPVSEEELSGFEETEKATSEEGIDFDAEPTEETPVEEDPTEESAEEPGEEEQKKSEKTNESLTEEVAAEAFDHKTEESDQELYGTDNAIVKCKAADVVSHAEDEKPVDCEGEKKPLEKPLTEDALPAATNANIDKLLDSEEFKEPISEEEVERIFAEQDEDMEALDDAEDIDDDSVNECVSGFLKEVYENVDGFKMTSCGLKESVLTIDGDIAFKSGNSNSTRFVFDKTGQYYRHTFLEGCNEAFGSDSSFKADFSVKDGVLKFENLSYSYSIGEKLVEGLIKHEK